MVLHWTALGRHPDQDAHVHVVDALIHATRCQDARASVATLDSALHSRLITEDDLEDVFAALPPRFGVLRRLLEPRSESGNESLVRLMLRALGCSIEVQKEFDGIGRVDFLVDGWLVVECDSAKYHGTWEDHERDRRRDAMLAARGYTTLRLTARMIMFEREATLAALKGLIVRRR